MTPQRRSPGITLGLVAFALVLVAPPIAAVAAKTCAGEQATLVVPPGGERFEGTPVRDVIVGTEGPDVIYGKGGDDLICAGAGDDLVIGGSGDDVIYGGPGDDYLRGGLGDDRLFGQDGIDTLEGEAGADTLVGGEGGDVLVGGPGADTLYGGAGDDKLFGDDGADRLEGGGGNDELQGGAEDDRLFGGDGDDFLWGDDGNDLLVGGSGDDLLQGGGGADDLYGQGGFDELWGGECGELAGAVRCRRVPSGRPEGSPVVDPGDTFKGGPGLDACNKSPQVPAGCDTYRGERPGSPWDAEASRRWWPQILQAFEERAQILLDQGKDDVARALVNEIEHAWQVAACESMGDPFQMTPSPSAGHPGDTVDGLFQHKSRFWAGRAVAAGYPGASVFDPLANARVTAWLVAESIEDYPTAARPAWVHWACDEALVNRGLW